MYIDFNLTSEIRVLKLGVIWDHFFSVYYKGKIKLNFFYQNNVLCVCYDFMYVCYIHKILYLCAADESSVCMHVGNSYYCACVLYL